jgi:predicted transcriptional regulator
MIEPKTSYHQHYSPCQYKTFHSALCQLLQSEFPGTFGPSVAQLFADRVHALYERFHPPGSRFSFGQVLWIAVANDDRPGAGKRLQDTRLVPIVLDLVTAQDIDDTLTANQRRQTRSKKVLRLFRQAFEQGGVLAQTDVALLLHVTRSCVSKILCEHQRKTGEMVPSRGTIHDLGTSVTHKAIICYKRLVEKKETSQVAQETFHSTREVEYYVQCLRRVLLCKHKGLSPEDTALATNHSLSLVQEYLDLIERYDLKIEFPTREEEVNLPASPELPF